MHSSALRSFVQAFSISNVAHAATCIPIFLTPALSRHHYLDLASSKTQAKLYRRRYGSVTQPHISDSSRRQGPINGEHEATPEAEKLVFSPQRRDPKAWTTLLESYLPLNLRLGHENIVEVLSEFKNIQHIQSLPLVLSKARRYSKIDLLSYLGVYQGRWEAVLWLVKAMMEGYSGLPIARDPYRQLPKQPWLINGQRLDQIVDSAIQVEPPEPCRSSIVQNLEDKEAIGAGAKYSGERQGLGQIWQSLGTMILQAADRSPEDPSYTVIMTNVFRILSHLHRIDAVPASIYNYSPSPDQTVLQRPPTLYILSRRIMSILSDLEFGDQWEEQISNHEELSYDDLLQTKLKPRVLEFGAESWLDLILWACVEGAWIEEGAWIVTEMERRKSDRKTQWSVISWQEICEKKEPKLSWITVLKYKINKTQVNQVGGLGMATGSDSMIEMGTRTISREVILALLDGVLNMASLRGSVYGLDPNDLQQKVVACKNLLERDHSELEPNYLNTVILRVIESSAVNSAVSPGILQRFIDLRPTKVKELKDLTVTDDSGISAQDNDTDDPAAILGLLHTVLHTYAREGNLRASLESFLKIQNIVDMKLNERINKFMRPADLDEQDEDLPTKFTSTEYSDSPTVLQPRIPVNTLVSFLDLITDSKFFEFGKWLLSDDKIDGGILDPESYSDKNLQPALLRFATATADGQILNRVLERLEQPLSGPILHALLQCQIAVGKWEAVESLLSHFQQTPGRSWNASDAMSIARAILEMKHASDASSILQSKELSHAQNLLQSLVHGSYNSKIPVSQRPDLSESKLANQLGRIFKSIPGKGFEFFSFPQYGGAYLRAHASTSIDSDAFIIILETLVEQRGSLFGIRFWEQWCLEPSPHGSATSRTIIGGDGGSEKVVTPTLSLLRTILRPIFNRRRERRLAAKEKERERERETQDHLDTSSSPTTPNIPPPSLNFAQQPPSPSYTTSNPPPIPTITATTTAEEEDEERTILTWSIDKFKKFGLSDREIDNEIPGSFPRVARAKARLGDLE